MIERRKHSRYDVGEHCSLLVSENGVDWESAEVCNISLGGLLFKSTVLFEPETDIIMRLINNENASELRIDVGGTILRATEGLCKWSYGVIFEPLDEDEEEHLELFIKSIV